MIPRLGLSASPQRHAALKVLLLRLVVIMPAVATAASRYAVSTDGMEVTDRQTGLIWRRCIEGMAWNGSTCAYATSIGFTWKQALQRAASETIQSGKMWRVPNIKELSSVADRSRSWPQPQVDPQAFPAPGVPRPNSPNYDDIYWGHYFWSSSPSVTTDYNGQPAALIIDFDALGIGPVSVVTTALVRLVRDSQ